MAKKTNDLKRRIGLQGWCIVITIIIVTALFALKLSSFNSSDRLPDLLPIKPSSESDVGSQKAVVKTGLFVKDFAAFDIIKNEFVMDATIWFEYNPVLVSHEIIDKFSFFKGEIEYRSLPNTKVLPNGDVEVRFDIKIKFSTLLDYRLFPFEDRRISLVLINTFVSPDQLIYKASMSGFAIDKNIFVGGFKYYDKKIEYGYLTAELETARHEKDVANPAVVFVLDFERSGIRKLLLIIIPLFIVFFISLFALSFDPIQHTTTIVRLSMGALTALLAYRFVIDRMSPDVGYSTFTDHLYSFVMVSVFIAFLLALYAIRTGSIIWQSVVVALYVLLNIATYYLLFIWA